MLKRIWISIACFFYFLAAAADVLCILTVIATPFVVIWGEMEVNWFTLVVFSILTLGFAIAFPRSYKGMIADFKEAWKK